MKESSYKTSNKLPLFLNTETVAKVLGVLPSSGYELMHIVVTNSVSLAPPQTVGLTRCFSSPTQTLCVCAGALIFHVLKISNRMIVPKEKFVVWVSRHIQGGAE